MGFDQLLEIIKKVRSQYPTLSKRMTEAEALSRWADAVGPSIAKHSRAIRVQDSILWVEVDHPAWRSELHHRKRQILDILNHGRPQPSPGAKAKGLAPATEILKDIFFVDPRPSSQGTGSFRGE